MRFKTTLAGINQLIGQLQATVAGLNAHQQLSESINALINNSKKSNK